MNKVSKVIAIDGPSGSGKSTVAKLVAEKLGLIYLDTGAMYRGIGYALDQKGISTDDAGLISKALETMAFSYAPNNNVLIEVNGMDLTLKIREHQVSKLASKYSQVQVVREFLVSMQREIAGKRASILEGRDIGTVVFPNAALKFFLTADPKVRAKRRFNQLQDAGELGSLTLSQVEDDIISRDKRDQNREIAPLKKAQDAIEIETSHFTIDEVVEKIAATYEKNKQYFS